ncbi:hypothetical protein BCR33DRAFT_159101 [Rhizoclosmatium globosum]|uniref:Uncharacterized protein n=1 Tax=Rhizoclosmatium globosum TaxID=329046 RepID=A0A1Y2CG73_9FUNG|nr:hypothetical protein BCR33DRAFT_159101 [Rhizoclosmatium globosum]|eukprot:ORY46040.1 hypothetical protein BCR33DRAFT_159101 [Rhizoclosmatium globosum]
MDAAQIERDFERMLRIKGQKITPELVKLPLESKQQLLVQNEKLSTPRPPTPPTKSASSNETIVPIRRSVFGQVGSLFRSPLTRSASVPLPLPLSPTPVPNPGTAESSFFRDVAVPLPLPLLSVTAPAQSTTQPIPQPVPQPNQIQTEDADLIRNFENVLASLNVSGSQKQDVLAMFEKANLESKKAILQKYSILLNHTQLASTTSIPPAPEPVNQIQQSDVRHVQSVENVQTLEPIPPPPSYDISQNTPPISNEPSQSSASALEIVMSPTIYPYEPQPNLPSNSDEVLNETEPHSFEVLADIVTERVPLSPPKPESALMINLSTTPPASPNLLSKSLDDNSLMPKSVEVIITQLMDQSLTSKALFRILSNLPSLLSDTSSVFQKQFTHVTVYILDLRASITGLDALQHVLRRLHDGTSFSDISRRGLPPTKSKQGSRNGTITFSSVRADEIRLRVLDCLSCFHRTDLVSTRNLVAEVVYLLMSMDGIILSENLVMRARAYDLAAVFCLEGVEALRLVQQGLEYIDGVGTLVPTLLDPFRLVVGGAGGGGRSFGAGGGGSATVNRDRKGKVPVDPAFETPEAGAGLDASVVWRFRISLLKFIVSYIDSDENVAGRSKLRKSLEAAGLRDVIEEVMLLASAAASDVSGNEIGEFVECVELYEMGRTDDADEIRQDAEIPRVAMQGAMSPHQITNDILLSLAASSSETKEVGTSILEHLQSFFAALKTTPQTINLLALADRLTYIIANAAFESYDDWRVVAHSLVDAVESASGFQGGSRELHNGMIHSLRQEIEDLKVNLLISQSSEEQRRQEIADLQEYISGQQIQAVSQSNLEDEVRRLKELVGTLAHERDEALAAVKTEKQLLRKKTILAQSAHQNVASGSSEGDLPVLAVPLSGGLQVCNHLSSQALF